MKDSVLVVSALLVSVALVVAAYLLRPVRYTFATCDEHRLTNGRVIGRTVRVCDGRTGRFETWYVSFADGAYNARRLEPETR